MRPYFGFRWTRRGWRFYGGFFFRLGRGWAAGCSARGNPWVIWRPSGRRYSRRISRLG